MAPAFGTNSGLTWGLSIVLLVVLIRILLFPLFVKQIKTQRKMMEIQPKVKELQQKYRGDRETMNQELMKLYRENNANPLSGCLPLLVQMPIFLALFRVLNSFKPDKKTGIFSQHYGIHADLVESAAKSKVFGAPISSSFRSSHETLAHLHASVGLVRGVTATMVVLMALSTFLTQRQLMARNAAQADTPMAQQQKILLYVLPLSFGVFGILYGFPVGVLLYWLTTNLWTMGQQFLVINRMHPAAPGTGAAAGGATSAASAPAKTAPRGTSAAARPLPANGPSGGSAGSGASRPPRQQPRNRSRKKRKRR
jgi:YidC/Oxa1 family membrane protein insertase